MSSKGSINIVKDYSKVYRDYRVSYVSDVRFSKMSATLAESIVKDVLEVFMEFAKSIGIFELSSYSEESEARNYTFINVWNEKNKKDLLKTVIPDCTGSKFYEDNVYFIKYKGKEYVMGFFDDADELGFNNVNGNPETYLICNVVRLGMDKRKLYEATFSFDIETMKFIEIYAVSIEYLNTYDDGSKYRNISSASYETIEKLKKIL